MVVATLVTRVICYFLYPNGDQRYTAVLFVLIPVALIIGVYRSTLAVSGTFNEPLEGRSPLSNAI